MMHANYVCINVAAASAMDENQQMRDSYPFYKFCLLCWVFFIIRGGWWGVCIFLYQYAIELFAIGWGCGAYTFANRSCTPLRQ